MFCLIKFTLKSCDSMSEEKEVILWNFLYALERNGQIYLKLKRGRKILPLWIKYG